MADTKRGREEQARNEARRQREREIEQARQRRDEPEPEPPSEGDAEAAEGAAEVPQRCHRRGCDEPAAFLVLERYLEDTGHGPVEATAALCPEHTAEEGPTRLDDAFAGYVFRVEPLPDTAETAET
ncbi:hypothetical protein C2R22_09760 [Salinigranum rubrum]|uniref:Uncharacterized protein n=1 Tax=Salinigranum rubrum TaxID=755307 RepID=A0A2I8VLE2_9EURY|nr:hypothetical protein [Salinigranum rubrum]AUV81899.1 hypothetical protein C2R22_09760 [Salinigranum rubrum]